MDLDFGILNSIQTLQNPAFDVVMPAVSFLGSAGWIWIVLCLGLLIYPKTRRTGVIVAIALIIDLIVVNLGIKPFVARLRPYEINTAYQLIVPPESDYSFPSGHAAASFSAASALFFARSKWWIPSAILAVIISFSRLYLYVHFPSDVLVGALLGILFGFVAAYMVGLFWKREPQAP